MEWLLIMATTGKVLVPRDLDVVSDREDPGAMDVGHDIKADVGGTRKAKEDRSGEMIVDITNGKLRCNSLASSTECS